MSEPIRYRPDWTYTGTTFVPFCRQQDNGDFVRYEEYAKLRAHVERLTKAGDAMAEQLDGLSFDTVWDFWNAAKEGKQS